jgi:hypothetical protein
MSGAATDDVASFESWRGRPLDIGVGGATWAAWSDIESPYVAGLADFPGVLQLRIPLLPGSGATPASGVTFTDCASGAYDAQFVNLGQFLVSQARGDSYLRIAWEANGNWYPWHSGNAASPTEWVQCFQHAVSAVRSAAPAVKIDWNMNADTKTPASGDPRDIYPGDAYVDVVGVDFYDNWPALTSDDLWSAHYMDLTSSGGPHGIGAWLAFAVSHGKPLSVPEWAIVNSSASNCGCGGDDPVYVGHMLDFFAASAANIAYESYFNLPKPQTPGDTEFLVFPATPNPMAAARYLSAF